MVDKFLNVKILKNPLNWLVVFSMALIAYYALHFILLHYSGKNSAPPSTQPITGSNFAY